MHFFFLSSIPYIVPSDLQNDHILEVSFLCILFFRNHQRVGQILITSLDCKFISLLFLLTDCYLLLVLVLLLSHYLPLNNLQESKYHLCY